ncbi:MAG: GNAT family N-acetyltransferase [Pseudomonadota bacterium]
MTITVTSQRLLLRPWRRKDRPTLEKMCRDVDMMRFVTKGRPMTDKEIKQLFKRQKRHLRQHRVCFFAMELIETNQVVGLAGLQPLDNGDFEIGWWVWKDHWGYGYASEAGTALIDYARSELKLARIFAIIDPENNASIGVAEKLGLRLECQKLASETISTRPNWVINYYGRTL